MYRVFKTTMLRVFVWEDESNTFSSFSRRELRLLNKFTTVYGAEYDYGVEPRVFKLIPSETRILVDTILPKPEVRYTAMDFQYGTLKGRFGGDRLAELTESG